MLDVRNVITTELMDELIEQLFNLGMSHLHLHTDASHLDGMNDINSLMKRLKEVGARACAITDHGNMHNVLRFYQACLVHDIKPILGFEAYISEARQLQKKSDFLLVDEFLEDDWTMEVDKAHLVLLAENFKGYQNLVKLTTLAYNEGSYVKPRIDYELLREYNEGIIVINGHVGTDVAKAFERACNPVSQKETEIMEDTKFSSLYDFEKYIEELTDEEIKEEEIDIVELRRQLVELQEKFNLHVDVINKEYEIYSKKEIARAYKINEWYMEVFGDRYYLEIQNHGLNIEEQVTPLMLKMAKDNNITLLMTNDAHYTWKTDADAHRIHMANGLNQYYDEFMGGDFEGFSTCDEFYVKDTEEMLEVAMPYGDMAIQALINTNEVVDRCNVEIEAIKLVGKEEKKGKLVGKWKTKEYLFPEFPIPAPFATREAYFEHLAKEGLKDRIENNEVDLEGYTLEDYRKRLDYEMEVINNMGFPTYFIILWDVLRFCRESDIPVGKGRGSGAGSLVAYSLRITDVDPLHYNLLFER